MQQKLDPRLLEMVQQAQAGVREAAATVDVMVALSTPLTPALRRDLKTRGLNLRSEIETILTGSIRLSDVSRLAGLAQVVKIEASSPLYPEVPSGGEG